MIRKSVSVTEFCINLEKALALRDMTIPEFAKEMGVTKVAVYNWINGLSVMRLDRYFKALEVLKRRKVKKPV